MLLLPGNSSHRTAAHSAEAQSCQETGHLSVTLHSLANRNKSIWSG